MPYAKSTSMCFVCFQQRLTMTPTLIGQANCICMAYGLPIVPMLNFQILWKNWVSNNTCDVCYTLVQACAEKNSIFIVPGPGFGTLSTIIFDFPVRRNFFAKGPTVYDCNLMILFIRTVKADNFNV